MTDTQADRQTQGWQDRCTNRLRERQPDSQFVDITSKQLLLLLDEAVILLETLFIVVP